jgi:hypothetical protein
MRLYFRKENTLFLFILILFLIRISFAQISGTIEDEIWDTSNSPYYITGNVVIKNLTILPGVVVLFDDYCRFDVNGTLIAKGTKNDSIIFALNPALSAGWGGISFDSTSSNSKLSYMRIQRSAEYGINLENASPSIQNCRVQFNGSNGIEISDCQVELNNCTITNNDDHGIYLSSAGKARLSNSLISRNSENGLYIYGGTVYLTNSIVSYNSEGGILLFSGLDSLSLLNSVVAQNSKRGILSFDAIVQIRNSIIYSNDMPSDNSGGEITIDYSAFEEENWSGGYTGTGNISQNPLFQDNTLFTLSPLSPCVDSGDPDSAYNDKCFPPSLGTGINDMGAYGGPIACQWYDPLYVTPHDLNFGRVTIDSTKRDYVKIKNYRDSVLTISAIQFTGTDAEYFSTSSSDFKLPPFDSMMVDIDFKPGKSGAHAATLQIISYSGADSVTLTGIGVVADILVTSPLDFGSLSVGDSLNKDLTIGNGGSDTLHILSIKNNQAVFKRLQSVERFSIPPVQSDTLSITFKPDSSMSYLDSLEIISNDPDDSPSYVLLKGTGLAPVMSHWPNELDFGQVWIDQDSTIELEIKNTGNDTLQINLLEIQGSDSLSFSLLSDVTPVTIAPGDDSLMLEVNFSPASVGPKLANLKIDSNDPFKNPVSLFLQGTGIASEINVSNDTLNFGDVPVDTSVISALQIDNLGSAPLIVSSAIIFGSDSTMFSLLRGVDGFVIPPAGNPDTIEVEFAPTSEGIKYAFLQIVNNDLQNNLLIIPLIGNAVIAPKIYIKQDTIDYGEQYISEYSEINIAVYNFGQRPLQIGPSQIIGEHASDFFIISGGDTSTIPSAGDSHMVQISFNPGAEGPRYAQLSIPNNDPLHNPVGIPLLGTGIKDDTPANIVIDSSSLSLDRGVPFDFKVIITDEETTIQRANLLFRQGGKRAFQDTSMTKLSDSLWVVQIPGSEITERGLDFYITAYHGGATSTFPSNINEIPASAAVTIDILPFSESTQQGSYQMISIPANTKDKTLKELFEDNLGEYDNTQYRFFAWDNVDSQYVELSGMNSSLAPGQALWLITRNATALDVEDCQSVPTNQSYAVNLHQGWNMIGVPFAFNVAWDSVGATGVISNQPHQYEGHGWILCDIIEPFQGYAVHSDKENILYIPPCEREMPLNKPNRTYPEQGEWQIQIHATRGNYHDLYNFAGVKALAKSDLDALDIYEPPPIGEFISLFFESVLRDDKVIRLTGDYRSPEDDQFIFDFRTISNFPGKTNLRFIPHNLPIDYDWAVVCSESKVKYPKDDLITEEQDKKLRLFVGSESFVAQALSDYNKVPEKFTISQNFPNPFNPITVIKYQLPRETKLSIKIYDILGRLVTTLIDNEYKDAGYYQVSWQGTNQNKQKVASGIYLLHLSSADYNKVIKMILAK